MKIEDVETIILENDTVKLKLNPITDEELPLVSVVTITKDRPEFVNLMIRNYEQIDYPKDKITWIIVDDSKGLETYNKLNEYKKKRKSFSK